MLGALSNLLRLNAKPSLTNVFGGAPVGVRYRARKGTRERKLKLKKKRKAEKGEEEKKKPWAQRIAVEYEKQRPFDDRHYTQAIDDVYFHRKFRSPEYTFPEVVQFHRETHHETVYNKPNCPLWLRVDIDLVYPNRPNKFQDPWRSTVELKEQFMLEGMKEPTILAFCENDSQQISSALEAGAGQAGGKELIEAVQKGEIKPSDYDYVVAHPLVITELAALRGLMKRNFPNLKNRTIGNDVEKVIQSLKKCTTVKLNHNDLEPDFGYIVTGLGFLNMSDEGLEGNFSAHMKDILAKRVAGKNPEDFILQAVTYTQFSFERLKVNWREYL